MKKTDFNQGWEYRCLTKREVFRPVSLPHDAMISEPRTQESAGGNNIGWYAAFDYEYRKRWFVPASDKGKSLILEFEGIYRNAEVFVNGKKAAFRPYGYTNFYLELTDFLEYGDRNEIRITVKNSDQPNSRWYSGTGIYRPVWLYEGKGPHIPVNGLRIRTLEYEHRRVMVSVKTSEPAGVAVEIFPLSAGEKPAAGPCILKIDAMANQGEAHFSLEIPRGRLWSCDRPHLYLCRATCGEDVAEEVFGIRSLSWEAGKGLLLNGSRVILRGACIHHDNGLLGACAFPEAEERKIRLLRENGYNAIRSAHNPCSKALLDACDRLGMLVLDEYTDTWFIHKTRYDYADYVKEWWRQDLKDMVEKDWNHPSVILYSIGNEVSETAREEGIELTAQMTDYLHSLDNTRPVTCGINIFFNVLNSAGVSVFEEEKAVKAAEAAERKEARTVVRQERRERMQGIVAKINEKRAQRNLSGEGEIKEKASEQQVGSQKTEQSQEAFSGSNSDTGSDYFYEQYAGNWPFGRSARNGADSQGRRRQGRMSDRLGDRVMKFGASLRSGDRKTRDAFASLDIAGYNYGIRRYEHDMKKYPDRLILGTESFCKDAYVFWEMAKTHPSLIGDFAWTGMDYIGETGEGAAEFADYYLPQPETRMTGGYGSLNLLGRPKAEAAYTRVAFEQEKGPFIFVSPVYEKEKVTLNGWQMSKALESWAWRGYTGERVTVDVYARAAEVELQINGRACGRKKLRDSCLARFHGSYEEGEVTAVIYDEKGEEIGRKTLVSDKEDAVLRLIPETETVRKNGLVFVNLRYTDWEGTWKPMEHHRLKACVENGKLLGFGSACPYVRGNYTDEVADTYFGEAMAVIRANGLGDVELTISDIETDEKTKVVVPLA